MVNISFLLQENSLEFFWQIAVGLQSLEYLGHRHQSFVFVVCVVSNPLHTKQLQMGEKRMDF